MTLHNILDAIGVIALVYLLSVLIWEHVAAAIDL